jgi:ferredoxin
MIKLWSDVLENQTCSFESETEKTLLDLAEENGVALPYGCRAGSCGSCRVQIAEGRELLVAPGAMEMDTLARCEDDDSVRLACRSKFKSKGLVGSLRIQKAKEL